MNTKFILRNKNRKLPLSGEGNRHVDRGGNKSCHQNKQKPVNTKTFIIKSANYTEERTLK